MLERTVWVVAVLLERMNLKIWRISVRRNTNPTQYIHSPPSINHPGPLIKSKNSTGPLETEIFFVA